MSIERSFQGLSVAIETMRIDEELMEIWLNEVCNSLGIGEIMGYNPKEPKEMIIIYLRIHSR